jgi:Tubulin like
MINILLGIGGTGAKVVEAALMLLASGAGPGKVHVGLIDQDQSNGNVARTRDLLSDLVDFRRRWGRKGEDNVVDWGHDAAPDFGAIQVEPLFADEDNALWCPTRTQGTLKSIVGENLDEGQRHLFNLLFMQGGEEQDLPLAKGYRGRAHVGATALVATLVDDENILLKRLRQLMEDSGRQPVNIFIVGSAFGGTGAAGFPTLARALHRIRSDKEFENQGMVKMGGMLMLPYFTFDNPEEGSEAVVTPNELLPKAQLALEYYQNLFAHEKTFDHFYALGWERLFPLGYHQAGSAEQANPALPPELFAATAILDFFAGGEAEADPEGDVRVMVAARQDRLIKWRDLPGAEALEPKVAQMLRFAVYWRHVVEPLLAEKKLLGKNWAQKLADGAKAVDAERPLNALRELIDRILLWAATLEHTGDDFWKNGPWNLQRLVSEQEGVPTMPVALRTALGGSAVYEAFDQLIRVDSGDFLPRAGATMHDELTRSSAPPPGEHQGIGRTLATVYAAASLR